MNEYLLQITCMSCGVIDESGLEISGPHVKSLCQHCYSYVKFISPKELPDILKVRAMIWEISMKDERLISSCKILCRFDISRVGMHPMEVWMEYWKLYIKIRQVIIDATS